MRWLIATGVALLASASYAQISVPERTAPHEPIVATCTFPSTGETQVIWEADSALVKFIASAPNAIHIWAPPGEHTIGATLVNVDFEARKFNVAKHWARFVVAGATPPVPPPTPDPPAPTPPTKLSAVILHETEDDSPAFSRLAIQLRSPSSSAAKWLKTRGHSLAILDDDSLDERGQPTKIVTAAKAAGARLPFAALLDQDDKVRAKLEIDQDESDGTATSADDFVAWMQSVK